VVTPTPCWRLESNWPNVFGFWIDYCAWSGVDAGYLYSKLAACFPQKTMMQTTPWSWFDRDRTNDLAAVDQRYWTELSQQRQEAAWKNVDLLNDLVRWQLQLTRRSLSQCDLDYEIVRVLMIGSDPGFGDDSDPGLSAGFDLGLRVSARWW